MFYFFAPDYPISSSILPSTLFAITHTTTPFVSIYSFPSFTKLNNPSSLPAGNGRCCTFNRAQTLFAVGCGTSPFIIVYNVTNTTDPSTWTVVPGISALPGAANDMSFSPDGAFLTIAHTTSAGVNFTILRTSDWSVVSNPATIPGGNGAGCIYNNSGTLLALLGSSGTKLIIYKADDFTTFYTPTTQPAAFIAFTGGHPLSFSPDDTLFACCDTNAPRVHVYNTPNWSDVTLTGGNPTGAGASCAFSPSGTYFTVGHSTTPFKTTYTIPGWSKVTDPVSLPNANVFCVAYDALGAYLAATTGSTPFEAIYTTIDWAKLANLSTLPAGAAKGCAFN